MKSVIPIRGITVAMLALLAISGCSTRYVDLGEGETPSSSALSTEVLFEVHDAFYNPTPLCVAVLPLQGDADTLRRSQVRRTLYAHLSPRGFRDIEIARVDYLIQNNGLDVEQVEDRAALGQLLNCDAFLMGEVSGGSSFYGVYSKVEAAAKLQMVRAVDGELLWESQHHATQQDGGLPFSPIGIAAGLFDAARNVENEQILRVMDDLARRMMSTIPDVMVNYSDDEALNHFTLETEDLWKGDLDQYLASSSGAARESKLRRLLAEQSLTTSQQEEVYQRLTTASGKARDYRAWGRNRLKQGYYEGALEQFERAIEIKESDSEAWFLKGRVLTKLNQLEQADSSFVKAIAHNPDRDDYYAALGYINSRRGDMARARAAYQMAIKYNPESGFAWYNLAVSDYNEGNYRDATEQFFNAGSFYLKQGRVDRVEQVILDLKDLNQKRDGSRTVLKYIARLESDLEVWVDSK